MKKSYLIVFISFLFCMFGAAYATEPGNIDTIKQQLIKYHDSGEYNADMAKVVKAAECYITSRLQEKDAAKKKYAIVLDIDETSMSAYKHMVEYDFGRPMPKFGEEIQKGDEEVIPSTLDLYNFAKKNNISVFFISGRPVSWYQLTAANLNKAGYKNFDGLLLRPNNYNDTYKSIVPFKSEMRKELVAKGYDILVNMGDQNSDLAGGFADHTYKLPNPYYYIP